MDYPVQRYCFDIIDDGVTTVVLKKVCSLIFFICLHTEQKLKKNPTNWRTPITDIYKIQTENYNYWHTQNTDRHDYWHIRKTDRHDYWHTQNTNRHDYWHTQNTDRHDYWHTQNTDRRDYGHKRLLTCTKYWQTQLLTYTGYWPASYNYNCKKRFRFDKRDMFLLLFFFNGLRVQHYGLVREYY
jgi:hypothetical protein